MVNTKTSNPQVRDRTECIKEHIVVLLIAGVLFGGLNWPLPYTCRRPRAMLVLNSVVLNSQYTVRNMTVVRIEV